MSTSEFPIRPGHLEDDLGALIAELSEIAHDVRPAVSFESGSQQFRVCVSNTAYSNSIRLAHSSNALGAEPDATVYVLERQELDFWPRWSARYFREREVEAEIRETRFRLHYFDECDFWQIFDRETSTGYQLMPHALGYPKWDPGSPLRNFVHWQLLEVGHSLMHAGTLGNSGRGIMLAGEGGSGKSATVLSGIMHGLNSVGDDYVAFQQEKSITASKAFEIVKLDPDRMEKLGIGTSDGEAPNWQGKHLLALDTVAGRSMPSSMTINAICLPFVAGKSRTKIARASAQEAFLALAPSGISQIPSARAEMFGFAASMSKKLPAYRVALGTEPDELVGVLKEFVEGLG